MSGPSTAEVGRVFSAEEHEAQLTGRRRALFVPAQNELEETWMTENPTKLG
jgi:hypothetical protein